MSKKALITGVSGQDGSYLAKFLLSKNYIVIGTDRRSSRNDLWRLKFLDIFDFSYFVHGNRDINNFKKIINGMGEYILEFVVSNKKLKQLIQGTMVDYYNSYGIGCNIMTHTILRYYHFHPLID